MNVPRELKVWLKVSRKWLYSGSPRAATSGLAATCRIVIPLASTNRPTSTSGNTARLAAREDAAAQPTIIVTKAITIEGIARVRDSSAAAGKEIRPYAMKKAKAMNCASNRLSVKMPFTAATSGSLRAVMKPQAKNRQVTMMKAPVTPAVVRCCTLFPLEPFRLQTGSENSVAQGGR